MQTKVIRKLCRSQVGAIPLMRHFSKRLDLKNILLNQIETHPNEIVPAVDSLLLLVYNLCVGKHPLYKLSQWVSTLDLSCIDYQAYDCFEFTDDRFGRALDKLYDTDRASLMTSIVLSAIKEFDIDLKRIHNDSTSVLAYGKIPGKTKTGLELKHGHSKDHRPDLKQLVFNLSISADGGVPVHHKIYPGNKTDDTVHIEAWNILVKICARPDFLYVADSKLCTDEQLNHIASSGGKAITILPNTWKEAKFFKDNLRKKSIPKTEVLRRIKPGTSDDLEYFSAYKGDYFTEKRGYKLHWIHSSEKKKRDEETRNHQLKKSEKELSELSTKLNKNNLNSTNNCNTIGF